MLHVKCTFGHTIGIQAQPRIRLDIAAMRLYRALSVALYDGSTAMTSATDAVYASLHRQVQWPNCCARPDPAYGEARTVWNGMVARNPGLIVRCATIEDIQAAVAAAHAANALTAVRCGGHSLAGHSTCDGGVVIDLSPMRFVSPSIQKIGRAASPAAAFSATSIGPRKKPASSFRPA